MFAEWYVLYDDFNLFWAQVVSMPSISTFYRLHFVTFKNWQPSVRLPKYVWFLILCISWLLFLVDIILLIIKVIITFFKSHLIHVILSFHKNKKWKWGIQMLVDFYDVLWIESWGNCVFWKQRQNVSRQGV